MLANVVQKLVWQGFVYIFGIFNLLLYLALALRRRQFKTRKTEQEELSFAIGMYDSLWEIPTDSFQHETVSGICPNNPLQASDTHSIPLEPASSFIMLPMRELEVESRVVICSYSCMASPTLR